MRCVKCHNEMQRVDAGNNVFYYECRHCGFVIGKPTESVTASTVPSEPDAVKTVVKKSNT